VTYFVVLVLSLKHKENIVAAYIDYAKAFDSVFSHEKLCCKLQAYGLRGNLLAWLRNFLTGRMQRTKVGHSLSSSVPVVSGVIQGSCLGPLLFVLYINDVVALFDQSCNCKLYADDLKLYMCMNSPSSV